MGIIINNLMVGFVRESQTRIRYEIYAEIARKEDFLLISNTFKEFANQKKDRAILLYKFLRKLKKHEKIEDIIIEVKSPSSYGTTIENLEISIKEQDEIWEKLYPNFAETAKEEGYMDLSNTYREFTQNERNISQRLKMFVNLIRSNSYSGMNTITFWKCLACGYEVAMEELPNDFNCPSCGHFKSYFQRKSLNIMIEEKTIKKKETSGWVCMECGYEVAIEELPDDWKCASCGRSKAYFKRTSLKPVISYKIESIPREKAHWVCLECGNEVEVDLPAGWKCPKCGFPKE